MSDQQNIGRGFLKEKLGEYQVKPPDGVWNSIASQLRGRSRRTMIIIGLSAAATIALAVTLGINYFGPQVPVNNEVSEAAPIHQKQQINSDSAADGGSSRETLRDKVVSAIDEIDEILELQNESHTLASEDLSPMNAGAETDDPELEALLEQDAETDLYPELEALLEQDAETDLSEERAEVQIAVVEVDVSREEMKDASDPETLEGMPGVNEDRAEEQVADVDKDVTEDKMDLQAPDTVFDIDENARKDPRWMVGAALSPLYSFRDAEANAMAGASQFESGMVAYAGGVQVSYQTASRLAIESGLFYNKMGIAIGAPGIQQSNQFFDVPPVAAIDNETNLTTITNSVGNIVARSGEVYVNNYKLNAATEANAFTETYSMQLDVSDQGIRQHLDYLELPFNLRYTVVDRDIELQVVGGMSTNFLVNNYVTMDTDMGTAEIGYLANIRSVNYSGNAGIGVVYHVRERFSLRLEPRFRYFLNSINDATLPVTRPYTLGLFTGMNYTF